MTLDKNIIKIKENKNNKKGSPKYIVSYIKVRDDLKKRQTAYEIISNIVKDKFVIIEISTNILGLHEGAREDFALNFIKKAMELGLNFRHKISPPAPKSLLSIALLQKNEDTHNVITYIPDEIWKRPDLMEIISTSGIKYYIYKNKIDENIILDRLNNGQILRNELYEIFSLIIYNSCEAGQMGIYTESLSFNDLKNMIFI